MPRKSTYPWHKWTNGEPHTVRYGVDFTCAPQSFISYLHNKARVTYDPKYNPPDTPRDDRRPMEVTTMTHLHDGFIDIQFRFWTALTDEEYDLMNAELGMAD